MIHPWRDLLPGPHPPEEVTAVIEIPKGSNLDLPRLGKPYSQAQLAREISRLLANGHDRPSAPN